VFLTGEYLNKMDDKGRIMIPAKIRNAIGDAEIVLARGLDNSALALYTREYFESTFGQLAYGEDGLSIMDMKTRMFIRNYIASSGKVEFDGNGRISIPERLRYFAGLTPRGEVMVLGMGSYLEIWSKEKYDEVMAMPFDLEAYNRERKGGNK